MNSNNIHGLYIIATPIGNLGDITLRALEVLGKIDLLLCEDTRVTGTLLAAHGIKVKMLSYHEHNADQMRPKILEMLRSGKTIGLVSDAGMPLISDPGYRLMRAVQEEELSVTCLPGANAAVTAVALSGLPTDRFFFAGFMPQKSGPRKKTLQEFVAVPGTLVFYESANRLIKSLKDMYDVLGDRPAAVVREMTKKFEEVKTGSLSELVGFYTEHGPPKGEIVIVVGRPSSAHEYSEEDIDNILHNVIIGEGLSVKDATAKVAAETGWKKKDVYARALAVKRD